MAEKRSTIILNYIKQKKNVSLRELCTLFPNFNEMTIRRDLILLEKNGYITRTRGGASISEDSLTEYFTHSKRSVHALEEKRMIAVKAASLIQENQSIYLDSGTTTLELAKMLPDISMFVITNGPLIAVELSKKSNIDVILTGGSLNKSVLSLSGPIATEAIGKVNIDLAFMGAAGFSVTNGFTNALYNECELKKHAIASSGKIIVLLDSSKIGLSRPFTFARPEDIDILITDKPLPPELQAQIDANDVSVIS